MEDKRDFFTSRQGFKDFLEGPIWKDIKHEMEALRETARDAMEGTESDEERRKFAYRARTVGEVIIMVEGFGEEAEEEAMKELDFEDGEEDNSINQELYDIEED